MRQLRHEPHLS
ncbi:hypothetical protein D043_2269A, partial [Vibrio parahaemolyticus EKP-021]